MAHNELAGGVPGRWTFGGRSIARLQLDAEIGLARIGQTAALQATKIEAVACTGRRALFEVALLTQAEQALASLVPLSTGRLQAIADIATLGIAEVMSDTVRRLSR